MTNDRPDPRIARAKHLYSRGLRAYNKSESDLALSCFRQAFEIEPSNKKILEYLILALMQNGLGDEALDYSNRLIEKNHGVLWAHELHAAVLKSEGRREEAEAAYEIILSIDPLNLRALIYVSQSLALNRKNAGKARTLLDRAIEIEPQNPSVIFLDGFLKSFYENDKIVGLDLLNAACSLAPHDVNAKFHLVNALIELKRYGDALLIAQELVLERPHRADSHKFLGAVLSNLGRVLDALESYNAAFTIDPDDYELRVLRAACMTECGEPADALRELEFVARSGGDHPLVNQYIGDSLLALEKPELAVDAYWKQLKINETQDAHYGITYCYALLGQYDIALDLFDIGFLEEFRNKDIVLRYTLKLAKKWISIFTIVARNREAIGADIPEFDSDDFEAVAETIAAKLPEAGRARFVKRFLAAVAEASRLAATENTADELARKRGRPRSAQPDDRPKGRAAVAANKRVKSIAPYKGVRADGDPRLFLEKVQDEYRQNGIVYLEDYRKEDPALIDSLYYVADRDDIPPDKILPPSRQASDTRTPEQRLDQIRTRTRLGMQRLRSGRRTP